jgi:hypothetical protein
VADVPSVAEQQSGHGDSAHSFATDPFIEWRDRMKKKIQNPNQPRPTAVLLLARAIIRTGFRYKDRGRLKAGQALYMKELATILKQYPEREQLELPLEDGPSTGS